MIWFEEGLMTRVEREKATWQIVWRRHIFRIVLLRDAGRFSFRRYFQSRFPSHSRMSSTLVKSSVKHPLANIIEAESELISRRNRCWLRDAITVNKRLYSKNNRTWTEMCSEVYELFRVDPLRPLRRAYKEKNFHRKFLFVYLGRFLYFSNTQRQSL